MIFDSDILIWYLRNDSRAIELIDATDERAISIVALMELLQGVRSLDEQKTIYPFLREFEIRILPLSETIGQQAAALMERHTLSTGLQLADALIAATALEHDEKLATGNTRHFRSIRNLELHPFKPRSA